MNRISENKQPAFTIIEIIVVIVAIGILASIMVVSYNGVFGKVKVSALQSELISVKDQLETEKLITGHYPATLDDVNDGVGVTVGSDVLLDYDLTDGVFCVSATSASNEALVHHICSDDMIMAEGDFI